MPLTTGKGADMNALKVAAAAALAVAAAWAGSASAVVPVSSVAITYYQVANGTDPDFPGGTPSVLAGSTLGPNGLPQGTGVNDIVGTEITWWSPALNSHVTQTGSGVISLPYNSNMFAPNNTGTNNDNFYETAVLRGLFTLSSNSTVTFNLGSDDDAFVYVDGTLFGQNPGIHGYGSADFTTPTLSAGQHSLSVFYADRERVAAQLSLNVTSQGVVITPAAPEPSTWLLMIAGVGGIGYALRRQRREASRNEAALAA